jgi:hypothetical protein
MKHKTGSNQGISDFFGKNRSFENYFSKPLSGINNLSRMNLSCGEVPYVVEWQMENDKPNNQGKM